MRAIAIVSMSLLCACAGGRGYLKASPGLTGPVSMSGSVFDSDGRVLAADDLEVVGSFETTKTFWATLASYLSLSGTWDLTPYLNEQMALHGGEAIVDFSTEQTDAASWLHYFTALTVVVPSYARVTISGNVVRRRHAPEAAAVPATVPAAPEQPVAAAGR